MEAKLSFAPKASSKSEDDGYLVCFVHDEAQNQSECQIIDAQNIEAGPVATIMMPFRVPYGFPCRVGWRLMSLPLTASWLIGSVVSAPHPQTESVSIRVRLRG